MVVRMLDAGRWTLGHWIVGLETLDVVGRCWTLLDVVGRWTLLDVVGRCWTLLDVVGRCWTLLDVVGRCWTLDAGPLDTGRLHVGR